jgi:serine/threonine-protein kinase
VAFLDNVRLKKVPVDGGPPATIAEVSGLQRGSSWGDDGHIVIAPAPIGGLLRVSADGGVPDTLVWPTDDQEITAYRWPEVLPGGRAVLFSTGATLEESKVMALDIESGLVMHVVNGTRPRYSSTGHLLFVTASGALTAIPFDPRSLEVLGSPIGITEGILVKGGGGAEFDVSDDGSFAYLPAGAGVSSLVLVEKSGVEHPLIEERREFAGVAFSPGGNQVAVSIVDDAATDIWVYDATLENLARRTFGMENVYPSWSLDGRHIVFSSDRSGEGRGLWRVPADGSRQPEPVYGVASQESVYEGLWSPDGEWFVFRHTGAATSRDIMGFRVDGDSTPIPIAQSQSSERAPALSPNGHWLAYVSDESGQSEVYVQEFPGPGGKFLVSQDGGTEPQWNPNGSELFYRTAMEFMAASVQTDPVFRVLEQHALFPDSYQRQVQNRRYDVHPDGDRFVMVKGSATAEIIVVLNWINEVP